VTDSFSEPWFDGPNIVPPGQADLSTISPIWLQPQSTQYPEDILGQDGNLAGLFFHSGNSGHTGSNIGASVFQDRLPTTNFETQMNCSINSMSTESIRVTNDEHPLPWPSTTGIPSFGPPTHTQLSDEVSNPTVPESLLPTTQAPAIIVRTQQLSFRTISGEGYRCSFQNCNRHFKRLSDLRRHHKSVHVHDLRYICGFRGCDRKFARKDKCREHQRRCPFQEVVLEQLDGMNHGYM